MPGSRQVPTLRARNRNLLDERSWLFPVKQKCPREQNVSPCFQEKTLQTGVCPPSLPSPQPLRVHLHGQCGGAVGQTPGARQRLNKLSTEFHSIDPHRACWWEILAISKCRRVSATPRGRGETPHVRPRGCQKRHRGCRGFVKAGEAERQKYLGQGSPTAQAETMLPAAHKIK